MNLRRTLRIVAIGLGALVLVAAIAVIMGVAMGLFAGKRPADLGFANGAFRVGDWKPNWVSSTAPRDDAKHYIAPFPIRGDPVHAWPALEAAIAAMPRASIVKREPGYLHVEFASARMGFVDDAEFALDAKAGVIHVRSCARLGVRDFGVNRERIESLRRALPAS